MDYAYHLFFKFMIDHPDMKLLIAYHPASRGISLTMGVYPKRKKIVLNPENLDRLSFNADSVILGYLKSMYEELTAPEEDANYIEQ